MTREEWDAIWQAHYDTARSRGLSPNRAIRRADHLMDLHNHGERPQAEEINK